MEKILLWAAMLITFGVSTLFAQDEKPITLDMAQKSVDDRYDGCKKEMGEIARDYLNKERKGDFRDAWTIADKFYSDKCNSPLCNLQKEHVMAMHTYTLDNPEIYRNFNLAVRTQGPVYTSPAFGYHALHFYLTDAIQTLNTQTQRNQPCVTTYRRFTRDLTKVKINQKFRFGAFTSSSLDDYLNVKFGEKSCFIITSCYGANITRFSKFPKQREVLIPPYEVFRVTKIEKRSNNKKLPCEVVYTVESTKSPVSNLNCALVPGHKKGENALG